MGNNPNGNIFFNMESLAFAMPLILLCSSYAYFKVIPLNYGLPVLGVLGAVLFVKAQMQKTRETKLTNLDEDAIQDLVGDEDYDDDKANGDAKKQNDKKVKLQKRLAAEKKRATNSKKKQTAIDDNAGGGDDDDDDVDALMTFAKGGAAKKKR